MKLSKSIVFLGQGKKKNIVNFGHLFDGTHDLITLTYDYEASKGEVNWKNIFAPGSTWAEGRNLLLHYARKAQPGGYDYYIFFDDDVVFIAGNFKEFAARLLIDSPDFAVPLCDIIEQSNRFDKALVKQTPVAFDQVVQAYSRNAVDEEYAIPYITKYDSLSWWYSCEINQLITLALYNQSSIQYNDIKILNGHHPESDDSSSCYKAGIVYNDLIQIMDEINIKYLDHPKHRDIRRLIKARCKDNQITYEKVIDVILNKLLNILVQVLKALILRFKNFSRLTREIAAKFR